MSWSPNDLVTDVDLVDYEAHILSMGETTWQAKRTKALEDWLFPVLKGHGFDPYRLRTRYEAESVQSYTGTVYTDQTGAAKDGTADDIDLEAVFATPADDYLYVGSSQPFRGLFLRLQDAATAVANVLVIEYFNGAWKQTLVNDATMFTPGTSFSGGGSVMWPLPSDWVTRSVNASTSWYWVRVKTDATPTGAKAGQVAVIRQSVLRAPATFRTLELIFREAPTGADGPWRDKADYWAQQASDALQRALPICGGEFDTDTSDLISVAEAEQTVAEVSVGWHLERA